MISPEIKSHIGFIQTASIISDTPYKTTVGGLHISMVVTIAINKKVGSNKAVITVSQVKGMSMDILVLIEPYKLFIFVCSGCAINFINIYY